MNDEELTKIAVAQLVAEGEKFKRRHELQYRLEGPARLRPNLRYFKNALKSCVSSNVRKEETIRSKAADELKYLDNQIKKRKSDGQIFETAEKKLAKRDSTQHTPENIYSYNSQDETTPRSPKNDSEPVHKKYVKKTRD